MQETLNEGLTWLCILLQVALYPSPQWHTTTKGQSARTVGGRSGTRLEEEPSIGGLGEDAGSHRPRSGSEAFRRNDFGTKR